MALVRDANGNLVDNAAPGYSSNPTVAAAQAAQDAQRQAQAQALLRFQQASVAQPGVAPGYSANVFTANAQAAADAQQQALAVQSLAPSLPSAPPVQLLNLAGPQGRGGLTPVQTAAVRAPAAGPRGGGAVIAPVTPAYAAAPVPGPRGTGTGPTPSLLSPVVPAAPTAATIAPAQVIDTPVVAQPQLPPAVTPVPSAQQSPAVAQPAVQQIQTLDNNSNNGINFGFGPGGATAYLAQKAQEDRQAVADRQTNLLRGNFNLTLGQLGSARSIGDIASARSQLQFLAPQLNTATQVEGRSQEANIASATSRQNAQLGALTQLQGAQIGANARLAAAQTTGLAGTQVANINAAGRVRAAQAGQQGPAGLLALTQAQRLNNIQTGADAVLAQSNDPEKYLQALYGNFAQPKPVVDPVTGLPYLPQTQTILQQLQLQQAQEQARKAK